MTTVNFTVIILHNIMRGTEKMDTNENRIKSSDLLDEIKILLKDTYIAGIRKRGDELDLHFANGQHFVLTIWETSKEK